MLCHWLGDLLAVGGMPNESTMKWCPVIKLGMVRRNESTDLDDDVVATPDWNVNGIVQTDHLQTGIADNGNAVEHAFRAFFQLDAFIER